MASLWIANDHGGYELKRHILARLDEKGVPYANQGADTDSIVRYPYYAAAVASAISSGRAEKGILICSTGIGMSIVANRFKNVRASLCTSTYMARMTRAHNDSNLLCLGGMITGKLEALDILDAWLDTPFEGGRHCISLGLLSEMDRALSPETTFEPEAFWPPAARK